jgi:hypothetical protein
MISKIRKVKLFVIATVLASVMSSSMFGACAARKVWIENISQGDGVVRLHIMYLQAEGDGWCYYA